MQIIVEGLLTTYERQGTGSKLVLMLHGWGDRSNGLHDLAHELAKDYTVIVPDLPGFGGTQSPPAAWDLSNYADFVRKFLAKIKINRVHTIVAHSNGGSIAIRGLATNKLAADRLVLLATAGIRGVYKGRMKALRSMAKAGKALTMPLPQTVQAQLRRTLYHSLGSDMLVAEHLQETFKKIVADDVRPDAAKLSLPTLLIYGERDEQTPVSYGKVFHQIIQGSTLVVLPAAGHFVHRDLHHKVVQLIRDFLR